MMDILQFAEGFVKTAMDLGAQSPEEIIELAKAAQHIDALESKHYREAYEKAAQLSSTNLLQKARGATARGGGRIIKKQIS